MTPDAHTDSYRSWELAIAEIRKQCTRPDGTFDSDKVEWLVNRRTLREPRDGVGQT